MSPSRRTEAGHGVAPEASRASQGPHWRVWQRAHDAAPEAFRWTRKMVHDRYVEAARIIRITGGAVGPHEYGSAVPEYVPDDHQVSRREIATAAECSRCSAAMDWQLRFLMDAPEHDAAAFNDWFGCEQTRHSFRRYCRERGANYDTECTRRDNAELVIATRLILDRVPRDAPAKDAEPEKPPTWAGVLSTVPATPAAAVVMALPAYWSDVLALARDIGLSAAHKLLWWKIAEEFPPGMPTGSLRKVRFAVLKRELKRQLGEGVSCRVT